jgi:hypothetical protein
MTNETNEMVAPNFDEPTNAEIDDMLYELPTTEPEFMALATRDRQRIAEGRHDMFIRLPLVAGLDRKIDDADFASQVEKLWTTFKASNFNWWDEPTVKRRRRKSSKKRIQQSRYAPPQTVAGLRLAGRTA